MIIALTATVGFVLVALATPSPTRADGRDGGAEARLLVRINAMRTAAGVGPLARNGGLDDAASVHSEAMARVGQLAHELEGSPDPATRARSAGVSAARIGENVSRGATAALAHEAILASEAHREQLLDPGYTHIGIAVFERGAESFLTQLLAAIPTSRPEPQTTEPVPVPAPAPATPAVLPPPTRQAPAPTPNLAPPPAAPTPYVAQPPAAQPPAAQPPAAQPRVVQPPAAAGPARAAPAQAAVAGQGDRRVVGYWVFSRGRWWYYPVPDGAQAGQELQPDLSVAGPPPGFTAQPTVTPGRRVIVPSFWASPRRRVQRSGTITWY